MKQLTQSGETSNAAIKRAIRNNEYYYTRTCSGRWHVAIGRDVWVYGLNQRRSLKECKAFVFGVLFGTVMHGITPSETDF